MVFSGCCGVGRVFGGPGRSGPGWGRVWVVWGGGCFTAGSGGFYVGGVRTVCVSLGERSYEIRVGSGLLARLGEWCRDLGVSRRCAVITDERVAGHYLGRVMGSLEGAGLEPVAVTVPAGEGSKRWQVVHRCHDALAAARLERRSLVVALGGGVVGDLAGFVAATYLRGVPFVQVPTTLLAQVDSSVGGKVGINLGAGKNLVGAFYQPRLVVADLDTLGTLPEREYRAGLAEVIKYGAIADGSFFGRLEGVMGGLLSRDAGVLEEVVARCCEIKAQVVSEDEVEGGRREILNFGHTIGHAWEAVAGYGRWLHGEAIAVGQVLEAELSCRVVGLAREVRDRLEGLLERAGLPTRVRWTGRRVERLLGAMRLDKKVRDGRIRFVLLRGLGCAEWGHVVEEGLVREVLGS
ncbi:3-dehydroquinate synthase [Limisphaera ngatamarikiensis]|uniref:3-dehydroquinate synthase n=1 Tax=Limisphaera ngatamarikiensis TaxID=1324935 RepID=A0A6M1RFY8_9BACT|nr:3-dehydroquinate synthase [Limisphaera ngatamarikiensis]